MTNEYHHSHHDQSHCNIGVSHHHHEHGKHSEQGYKLKAGKKVLTIRSHSGLSGDMFLCGLIRTLGLSSQETDNILNGIFPALKGSVQLVKKEVNHIAGWHCSVQLPHEHQHRNLDDIFKIISQAQLSEKAKSYAVSAFSFVAEAEAAVHSLNIEEVHFHEVGALDSILDICLTCELFVRLNPDYFVVSPLPIADGVIHCAHGFIPSPAPAVQALLAGIPVRPFGAEGETITPTALALLKAFNPTFGGWPMIVVEKISTIYGTYTYPEVPNGALFVYGTSYV
ncbi:LarC family nickel insertion protein [Turicimonas muris]|uniref:LarC family nickel insertion protein n=1 Tax=Turicimonas muris TaxID=1796652 RepID=A0A227KPQ9_9BURK|nr:nickel insertion protein [Turicimonas muris]ANU67372.2 hypothetical protein A4V04_07835 [Burkholderiales bacterium YL45]MBS4767490.1 LarC family nickel insertion protein [Burkholderiales bacterium]OXE50247.1 hypothetical protein ADH67_04455 [Turicimonas muris]QQQ97487.1 LarC family nickel insertion protein [Turicimonas muris]